MQDNKLKIENFYNSFIYKNKLLFKPLNIPGFIWWELFWVAMGRRLGKQVFYICDIMHWCLFCWISIHIFTGVFDIGCNEAQSFNICKHHRDRLGIYWRGQTKNCQIPPEMAGHKSAVKGERGLIKYQSAYITKMTGKLISVGSGMLTTSFLNKLFLYLNQKNKNRCLSPPSKWN